jgi:hypothetical protein
MRKIITTAPIALLLALADAGTQLRWLVLRAGRRLRNTRNEARWRRQVAAVAREDDPPFI